jgi:hypothetical protein
VVWLRRFGALDAGLAGAALALMLLLPLAEIVLRPLFGQGGRECAATGPAPRAGARHGRRPGRRARRPSDLPRRRLCRCARLQDQACRQRVRASQFGAALRHAGAGQLDLRGQRNGSAADAGLRRSRLAGPGRDAGRLCVARRENRRATDVGDGRAPGDRGHPALVRLAVCRPF